MKEENCYNAHLVMIQNELTSVKEENRALQCTPCNDTAQCPFCLTLWKQLDKNARILSKCYITHECSSVREIVL
jgi:hypothetical protein